MSKYISDLKTSAQSDIQIKAEEALKKLTMTYDETLTNYVQRQNQKYSELLQIKTQLYQKVVFLEKENKEMSKRVVEARLGQTGGFEKEEFVQKIQQLQTALIYAQSQKLAAQQELQLLKAANSKKAPIFQAQKEERFNTEGIDNTTNYNRSLQDQYQQIFKKQNQKNSQLSKMIGELRADLDLKKKEVQKKEKYNGDLLKDIERLKSELADEIRDQEQITASSETTINNLKQEMKTEIEIRQRRIQDLQAKALHLQTVIVKQEEANRREIQFRESMIDDLRKDIVHANAQKWKELQKARMKTVQIQKEYGGKLGGLQKEIREFHYKIGASERRFVNIQETHKHQLEVMNHNYESQLNAIKDSQKDILKDMQNELESVRTTNRQLEHERKNIESELQRLRYEVSGSEKILQERSDVYEKQIAKLISQIYTINDHKAVILAKQDEQYKEILKLIETIEELKKQIEKLHYEKKELSAYYDKNEKYINDKYIFQIQQIEQQHRSAIYDMETMRIYDIQQINDTQIKQEILRDKDHREQVRQLQTQIANMRELFVNSESELKLRIEQSSRKHEQEIEEIKENYDLVFNEMKLLQNRDFQQARDHYDEMLIKMSKELQMRKDRETQALLSELRNQKQQEIERILYQQQVLDNEWKTKYNQLSARLIKALEEQKLLHQRELEEEDRNKKALQFKIRELESKNSISELRREELLRQNTEYKKKNEELQNRVNELVDSNRILEKDRESLTFELTDEKQRRENIETELNQKFNEQMKIVLANHREFVEEMEKNFVDHDKQNELKTMFLNKEIAYFQEQFNLRPSRNQDIRRIQILEENLKVTLNQLQYLLMEIINQQPIYNKIFPEIQDTGFMDELNRKARILREVMKRRRTQFYKNQTVEESLKEVVDQLNYQASIDTGANAHNRLITQLGLEEEGESDISTKVAAQTKDPKEINGRMKRAVTVDRTLYQQKEIQDQNQGSQDFEGAYNNNGKAKNQFSYKTKKATDVSSDESSSKQGMDNNLNNDKQKQNMGLKRDLEALTQRLDLFQLPSEQKTINPNIPSATNIPSNPNIKIEQNQQQNEQQIQSKEHIDENDSLVSEEEKNMMGEGKESEEEQEEEQERRREVGLQNKNFISSSFGNKENKNLNDSLSLSSISSSSQQQIQIKVPRRENGEFLSATSSNKISRQNSGEIQQTSTLRKENNISQQGESNLENTAEKSKKYAQIYAQIFSENQMKSVQEENNLTIKQKNQ